MKAPLNKVPAIYYWILFVTRKPIFRLVPESLKKKKNKNKKKEKSLQQKTMHPLFL